MRAGRLVIQNIETAFGWLVAQWSNHGLIACEFLGYPSRSNQRGTAGRLTDKLAGGPVIELAGASERLRSRAAELERRLHGYSQTGHFQWDLADLDWSGVSAFHRVVLEHCSEIPAGKTLTYGQLAALAGRPSAARAVGGAMARNRWPIVIPCHRVVGASGKLTGYSGAGGVETKQRLLDFEAVHAGKHMLLST